MLMNIFGPISVETSFVDICDLKAVEAAIAKRNPEPSSWRRSPVLCCASGNWTSSRSWRAQVGAALITVDSTFTPPLMLRPLDHGASIVVHSATKYLAGHGDVLGGVAIPDKEHADACAPLCRTLGPVMGPFESYLTMRGIKTLALRIERQCANVPGRELAGRAPCRRPVFTGDATRRSHRRAPVPQEPLRCHGLLRIERRGREGSLPLHGPPEGEVVRATSLGDVHTITSYRPSSSHRELTSKHRQRLGIRDSLIPFLHRHRSCEKTLWRIEQALRRSSGGLISLTMVEILFPCPSCIIATLIISAMPRRVGSLVNANFKSAKFEEPAGNGGLSPLDKTFRGDLWN